MSPEKAAAHGRLVVHRNPLRMLFSPGPWAAAAYLLCGPFLETVSFTVVLTAVLIAASLSLFWFGIPLLLLAAAVARLAGDLARGLTRLVGPRPEAPPPLFGTWTLPGGDADTSDAEPAACPGAAGGQTPTLMDRVRHRWTDRVTWNHLGYLIGLYVPLMVLDVTAFALWLGALGGITIPIWYRYIPDTFGDGSRAHGIDWGNFPHGPHGPGGVGVWIGDDASALAAAAGFLVVFLLANYAVVTAARLHSSVAARLLGPAHDPLGPAKRVLAGAGPLH